MAIVHVIDYQDGQGTTSASTSNATPGGSGVGFIVAGIIYNGGTLTSVTDTYGNTYSTVALGSVDGAGLDNLVIAYAQASGSAGSGHVTVNISAGTCVIGAGFFTGLATSSPLDRTQNANSGGANGTALDSGAAPTTQFANELLIGLGTQATGATVGWTAGAGYTTITSEGAGASGRVMILEYRIVSAAAAYNATATSNVSAKWGMGIATFSDTPVPGGGPGPSASLLYHRKNVLYFI